MEKSLKKCVGDSGPIPSVKHAPRRPGTRAKIPAGWPELSLWKHVETFVSKLFLTRYFII